MKKDRTYISDYKLTPHDDLNIFAYSDMYCLYDGKYSKIHCTNSGEFYIIRCRKALYLAK